MTTPIAPSPAEQVGAQIDMVVTQHIRSIESTIAALTALTTESTNPDGTALPFSTIVAAIPRQSGISDYIETLQQNHATLKGARYTPPNKAALIQQAKRLAGQGPIRSIPVPTPPPEAPTSTIPAETVSEK